MTATTSPIELRFRELCNAHPAVARYWIPGTTIASLIARDEDGNVAAAELVDASGAPLTAPGIAVLVGARIRAQREVELATDNLVAHLSARLAAGVPMSELATAAADAGMSLSSAYYLIQRAPRAAAKAGKRA